MRKAYQRKTEYVPYGERRFFVQAAHRPEADPGMLTELFLRLAVQRVAEARELREATAKPSSLKLTTIHR